MVYLTERITIDPDLCNGKPTIRGLRITVNTILNFLSSGETKENILNNFPDLEGEDINACLSFASKITDRSFSFKEFAA